MVDCGTAGVGLLVLKANEMFLRGAECTACCAVRSATVLL
jgi:hypothetical protein